MANNAMQIVGFGILAVVVAMAIVIFFPVSCLVSNRVEGFAVQPGPKTCPKGTKMYIDKEGNTNCCSGEVSGSMCDGAIECTFSSNAGEIPFCGAGRVKRYDGEIWPMVKQIFDSSKNYQKIFTENIMPMFNQLVERVKSAVPSTISKASLDSLLNLQKEEVDWQTTLQSMTARDLQNRAMFEEETMRIITKTLAILQQEPIAKDPFKLAAKLQEEACKTK